MKLLNFTAIFCSFLLILSCSKDDDQGGNAPTLNRIILTSPEADGTLVQVLPEFAWEAYDSEQTVNYSIFIGTEQGNIPLVASEIQSVNPTFTVDVSNVLMNATTYYWKVQANIQGAIVAESEIQSFVTELITTVQLTENADYPKRINASAAAFNDKLWIVGGKDAGDIALDDIWSSTDGITWTYEGALNGTVYGHKLITFNNKLRLYGGIFDGFVSSKIFSSVDGVTWVEETETTPFSQYNNALMTVYNGKLYRVAGYNASAVELSDERATYSSIDGLNWILETANHGFESKYSFLVTAINNNLIALEPSADSGENSITLYTSSDGITWNNETTWMTAERGYTSIKTVKLGDKLILITPPPSNISSSTTFYESENGIDWSPATMQTTPIAARNYNFVALGGSLYAIGGTTITTQVTSVDNQVWKLN
ncbi:hypothetical protein N7U66_05510 [Lacinutrix neustonica]|uniref:Uncharacterized protein n=1 Tax=Lacinutrix neustonica TaxID=2980107 RepID=A0A9E8MY75_9FLAO|nr:hypothetical protein [Lacinutrix neustonica]WAC03085.1 hypothetical protein N7U66_05510 [Lacinutrix neustonica]